MNAIMLLKSFIRERLRLVNSLFFLYITVSIIFGLGLKISSGINNEEPYQSIHKLHLVTSETSTFFSFISRFLFVLLPKYRPLEKLRKSSIYEFSILVFVFSTAIYFINVTSLAYHIFFRFYTKNV